MNTPDLRLEHAMPADGPNPSRFGACPDCSTEQVLFTTITVDTSKPPGEAVIHEFVCDNCRRLRAAQRPAPADATELLTEQTLATLRLAAKLLIDAQGMLTLAHPGDNDLPDQVFIAGEALAETIKEIHRRQSTSPHNSGPRHAKPDGADLRDHLVTVPAEFLPHLQAFARQHQGAVDPRPIIVGAYGYINADDDYQSLIDAIASALNRPAPRWEDLPAANRRAALIAAVNSESYMLDSEFTADEAPDLDGILPPQQTVAL